MGDRDESVLQNIATCRGLYTLALRFERIGKLLICWRDRWPIGHF